MKLAHILLAAAAGLIFLGRVEGSEWPHGYPAVEGLGGQVYFAGYHLPILNAGPTDPAPSPDGKQIAFAARGWLWVLDLKTAVARRTTSSTPLDSRPAWAPNGQRIAFVRDDRRNTFIYLLELSNGEAKKVLTGPPSMDLDPVFSPDGRSLYFSSAASGKLDLWRLDLTTGSRTQLTDQPGAVLRPIAGPSGADILYFRYVGNGADEVRLHQLVDSSERVLITGDILSQSRPALSPDGRTVAMVFPGSGRSELKLFSIERPDSAVALTDGLALTPAWSADGQTIYFTEADRQQRMVLRAVPSAGGKVIDVPIVDWDWQSSRTARVRITGGPARLSVRDYTGHPAIPDSGQPRMDLVNGRVYFYGSETTELTVPAGEIEISAARGLATAAKIIRRRVRAGETRTIDLKLTPLWDPRAAGYVSADHHLHLNYGGPYQLLPDDLLLPLKAEDLDIATPLLANLGNRIVDETLWGWSHGVMPPLIQFWQEVRPHLLGHVGLVGTRTPFWPWFWGPGYEIYQADDRPNSDALRHARREGGMNIYVHPDPRPISLIPDAVLGEVDAIELACLWSDALGAADTWYMLLNLGIPIAPSAGSDSMVNFFRMMPIGATRSYVRTAQPFHFATYLQDLKAGRSFVTNGPLLEFVLSDTRPGEVLGGGNTRVSWRLDLYSAIPVETVELLVNGEIVHRQSGLPQAGKKTFSGKLDVPAGGWVAARAHGGRIEAWPGMGHYAFAHTGPIWIGHRGSTIEEVQRVAAGRLLEAVNAGSRQLREAYRDASIPKLEAHFSRSRQQLQRLLEKSQ